MAQNRDIKLCVVRLQAAWHYLKTHYALRYPEGPALILVETFRTAATQTAYFAQGRKPLTEVNRLREAAGLWPISAAENKRRITFKGPGGSKHEATDAHGRPASKAFDIGFTRAGEMVWDAVNYQRAARILREAYPDLTWGADWDRDGKTEDERFVDQPHFEVA